MNMCYSFYTPAPDDHKSQLIKKNLPMVEKVVERMILQVPSFMARDDIMSAAMVGLINAAERFDESKGVLFRTFAEHRIRGAIFDEVRKLDWFAARKTYSIVAGNQQSGKTVWPLPGRRRGRSSLAYGY